MADTEWGIPLEHGTVVFNASDGEPGIRPKTCAEAEAELQEARRLLEQLLDWPTPDGLNPGQLSMIRTFLGVDDEL